MTQARIIDGKAMAVRARARVAGAVEALKARHGLTPGLAVVLVGEDPASQVYVASKKRQCLEAGMASFEIRLPASTGQADVLAHVADLNADPAVHGIIVQLPLPSHIDTGAVVVAIDPNKDVDGLHPMNAGLLASGSRGLVPCTPQGCMEMLAAVHGSLAGMKALVIGRSILFGRPMGMLLLNADATVTYAHSRTKDLAAECLDADILIAAIGKPYFVRGDWVKPGATVLDVGINRVPAPEQGDGKTRIVGDVDFEAALARAGAITPVPGGVGALTPPYLLHNTVLAACLQHGIDPAGLGL